MPLQIISARPGLTTSERVLELIRSHPEGIGIWELSDRLNRPVSTINLCLKPLICSKQVYVRLSSNKMQKIYYPFSKELTNKKTL